jgi:CHAD domain-containing protein
MAAYSKWIDASADESVVDVAVRSLQSRLEPVHDYLKLAAECPEADIEYVHQMRVWSRRAVAAVDTYRNLLPKSRRKWMKLQLRRIRRSANDARDDDVFAQRLATEQGDGAPAGLLERVKEHRVRSQQPIDETYGELIESGLFAERAAKLVRKVRLRAGGGSVQFAEWAQLRIQTELGDFFQAASGNLEDVDALHKFRIAGKQLRYAGELLAPAFPKSFRSETYPLIQNLQDRLGQINDHASAQVRLQRWIDSAEGGGESDCLHEMLAQEQRLLAQTRNEFFAWWNGKREKELRKALKVLTE